MACTDPCSCCHGACCTGSSCAEGVNCYDCEAEGGVWQGAGSTCTPNPCEGECASDEDCGILCERLGRMIDPEEPCPAGWSGSSEACQQIFNVDSCDECNSDDYPAPEGMTDYGLSCYPDAVCCDGVCYPEECPPP